MRNPKEYFSEDRKNNWLHVLEKVIRMGKNIRRCDVLAIAILDRLLPFRHL